MEKKHKKDFDGWNEKKKEIHHARVGKLYHEREVWWCSLGANVGFEEDGTGMEFERPVLILKGLGPHTCLVVPLTTSSKKHKMRVPAGIVEGQSASALISQVRVVDTKRFTNKVGFLEKDVFERIQKAVKGLF
ncbi:MAG: type II toxin-antitoxin system PemK/MazF family toxin [Patescibacteria group bacterium]|nr:type II toxin-antitoxin system PemK/MazF family toxin [Patescibacteria group bacterium]